MTNTPEQYDGLSPERFRDIDQISRYMMADVTPEDRTVIENRLFNDREFFLSVEPIIAVWQMPVDWDALLEERARTRAEESAVDAVSTPSAPLDTAIIGTIGPKRVREPGVAYAFETPEQNPLAEQKLEKEEVSSPWDLKLADLLMEGAWKMTKIALVIWAVALVPFYYYVQIVSTPHPTVTVIQQPVPATVVPGSTLVEAKLGEDREFTLHGGSRVVLRGGSRFWYRTLGLATGAVGTLQGELAVDLKASDRPLLIHTAVGRTMLMPGSYAVRCSAACGAMLVTVGATGFAAMMSPDSTKERVSLLKNEKGALKEGGTPEKVAGDYAYDWPKLLAPLATAKP